MNQQFIDALEKTAGPVLRQEPMKKHTTFRVGGPADMLIQPDRDALSAIIKLCRQYEEPYYVIGNGSNLLVGDGGIRGLVIQMTGRRDDIAVEGKRIMVGAGVLLSKAAHVAAEHQLSGMEFAAGIPGTIGGAVVMNAGAYGGEMKDIIETAVVVDGGGRELELSTEELELGYRHSCIPDKGYFVKQVTLRLTPGDSAEIRARMEELKKQRVEKQPLEYPSAGSTFKRPEGYFAGKLIMDAGLRGYQVGGAQVSEKHCGFVINRKDATAQDICTLMQHVTNEVQRQFGVTLEPEVKMIGEFTHEQVEDEA